MLKFEFFTSYATITFIRQLKGYFRALPYLFIDQEPHIAAIRPTSYGTTSKRLTETHNIGINVVTCTSNEKSDKVEVTHFGNAFFLQIQCCFKNSLQLVLGQLMLLWIPTYLE